MPDKLIAKIKESATRWFPEVVTIRRDLHQFPELSFQEKRTGDQIQAFLTKLEIPFTTGWAGYGVVATIKGKHPGPKVMLRGDMDALPIAEENDVPYKSMNTGIMHACGHDVHTSCLLGTAAILAEHKDELHGEVGLIFQPGEEKFPGGASIMLKEGLFKESSPDWIIAQHVHPPLPAGHVGFRSGLYMASADEMYIKIIGKGGHAAMPHQCIDPIVIAARLVTALQEVISRGIDPISPAVLTIGKIYSDGGATNVIPDVVHLEGTLRAMNETWREQAKQRIKKLVTELCEASGATVVINMVDGYPSLINHDKVTEMCRASAIAYLGEDKVHELPQRMSSEDFAFYSQQVPSTFYRLGTGGPDPAKNFPVHSNQFDIDETSLETGIGLMAFITMSNLKEQNT